MSDLVSIEDAREHLYIDDSAHDPWLSTWIPAISQAVLLWLKDDWRAYVPALDTDGMVIRDSDGDPIPEVDSNGDLVVLPVVQAAVLVELASQFRFREGEGKDNAVTPDAGHGYVLNKVSTALLTTVRRPTVA